VRRFTCRNETLFALFAAAGAKFRQDGELFLGLRNIAGFDIKLAEVFAGRLVVRLQFQRLGVIGQRRFEVAGLAQGEAEQVVDVGLLGVTRIRWRAAVIATSAAIPALRAMPAPVWFVPRHTRSAAFENISRRRQQRTGRERREGGCGRQPANVGDNSWELLCDLPWLSNT
jgi:hypothetical protein